MFKKKEKIEDVKKRRWPKRAAIVATGAGIASALFVFANKRGTSK